MTTGTPYPPHADARKVVWASSVGTVFEWYDFYLYIALSEVLAKQFFQGAGPQAAGLFAILLLVAGFVVRPVGAIIFGRLGDVVGRKLTFTLSVVVMGLASLAVVVLPDYASIGIAAPILLVILRMQQGLALGGEYGGAVVYVAEFAPPGRVGRYTAWVQATATAGLMLSLLVVLGVRSYLGETEFANWGWRLPFLGSALLLGVSVYTRFRLRESPAFALIKAQGRRARRPLREAFGQWSNLRLGLIALFGLTAGQAVVWYTGQFYTLLYLTQTLMLEVPTATLLVVPSLLLGLPFFVLFGALSDRWGRKPFVMAGLLLAALTYFPAFTWLGQAVNPQKVTAALSHPVVLEVHAQDCATLWDTALGVVKDSACNTARQVLVDASIKYVQKNVAIAGEAQVWVGGVRLAYQVSGTLGSLAARDAQVRFERALHRALQDAGHLQMARPDTVRWMPVVLVLTYLVVLAALVYGPLAALLVEMFPTRIRYTGVSLPYQVGNGWFGGLLPTAALVLVNATGNILAGLWCAVIVAAATFVVGMVYVPNTPNKDLNFSD